MEHGSIANIPIIYPTGIDAPWLVAFTAIAGSPGLPTERRFDYRPAVATDTFTQEPNDRSNLEQALAPLRVVWLSLEHGNGVVLIPDALSNSTQSIESPPKENPLGEDRLDVETDASVDELRASPQSLVADAAVVTKPGFAAALTTADCLPIIIACPHDRRVAVIHAGWRGLACGVIENTLGQLALQLGQIPEDATAWIGPAIQQKDYEIDMAVKRELMQNDHIGEQRFKANGDDHYLADLQGMAEDILIGHGLRQDAIEVCPLSTRTDPLLHSARRDSSLSGRMATVVGIITAS